MESSGRVSRSPSRTISAGLEELPTSPAATPLAPYVDPPSTSSGPASAPGNGAWTNSPSTDCSATEIPSLAIVDLELIHHYATNTVPSFELGETRLSIWSCGFVQLGFSRPYLLYATLALASLHLYLHDPTRSELAAWSSAYHTAALRLIQPVIANMDQDDSIPIFAATGLIALYALAEVSNIPARVSDPIDDILSCFQSGRGIRIVMSPYFDYLVTTWMAPCIVWTDCDEDAVLQTVQSKYSHLLPLRDLASRTSSESTRRAYLHAIDNLLKCMAVLSTTSYDHPSLRFIHNWFVDLDVEILDMLKLRDPLTLVIMAHYTVMMGMRPYAWWLCKWPPLLMARIDSLLGSEWDDLLRWPRQMVFGGHDTPLI